MLMFWGRILGVAAALSGAALLLTSAWLIVRAAEQPPVLYLMVAIVGVRFFGFARTGLRYAERLVTHDHALRSIVGVRTSVYAALERQAGQLGTRGRRGDLVRRVVADVDSVLDRSVRIRGPWITAIATTIAVSAAVALIDARSGLAVGVGATVAMVVARARGRSGNTVTDAHGQLAAEVAMSSVAAAELTVSGFDRSAELNRVVSELESIERASARHGGRTQAFVLFCTAAVTLLLAQSVDSLDPVLASVVLLAPLALVEPLEAIADAERLRPEVVAAEARLDDLARAAGPFVEPTNGRLPRRWDLTVDNLVVGWDQPLIEPVSFVVPEGGAVVVTGPSGVGKSTLAMTLTRYLDPADGRVELGGIDLNSLAPDQVRSVIGLLSQDDMVFDTTVRENLRIAAPDASDDQLNEVLRRVGLGGWLGGLAGGLDGEVGERGQQMSGGERQRLAIARLLLAQHRILIVDEPTEHLDAPAAEALMDDLLALCPGVSLIVLSHDPQVIERVAAQVELKTDTEFDRTQNGY